MPGDTPHRGYAGPVLLVLLLFLLALVWPDAAPSAALLGTQAMLGGSALALVVVQRRTPRRVRVPRQAGAADAGSRPAKRVLHGRARDVEKIVQLHKEQRAKRIERSRPGPVVILLHGVPGVGKSALAAEVSGQLCRHYGRGPVVVNLNGAGEPLGTAHALAIILRGLGWTDPLPDDTLDRVRIFRALAATCRPLIILDAVSDPAQLPGLIPNAADTAVIITSRRNFGPQLGIESYCVAPLPAADALDMLLAITRTAPDDSLSCATRLADIGDGLPAAIRAIGERVVFERKTLCGIHETLRPPGTRLRELTRASGIAVEGIADEYRRLSRREQQALCLLTLVGSPTFAGWVVCPLLDVPATTGEMVMTELTNARLLEPAGPDHRFDQPRYRMRALVRLFAESRLDGDPELLADCHDAAIRLRTVYRQVARHLVAGPGSASDARQSPGWVPEPVPEVPATGTAEWIRAELLNLVDVAESAMTDEPDLAWRLCARFGDRMADIDDGLPPERLYRLTRTLAACADAARNPGRPLDELDVRLAEITAYVTFGRFAKAEDALERVEAVTAVSERHDDRAEVARRAAEANLRVAEGYAELLRPERAAGFLARARGHLRRCAAPDLEVRAEQLAELSAAPAVRRLPAGGDAYWYGLMTSVREQRAETWQRALATLDTMSRDADGDVRRTAVIQRRIGEVYVAWYRSQPAPRADLLLRAGRHAMRSVLQAERLGHTWGIAYGRMLVAETMRMAGNREECLKHVEKAREALHDLTDVPPPLREALSRLLPTAPPPGGQVVVPPR